MLGVGVTTTIVVVECLDVGLSTVTKAIMNKGMSNFMLAVYSNIFLVTFVLPSFLIFFEKTK